MATGSDTQEQCPGSVMSEDLDQLMCQPFLEDGTLHEAVGLCIDCQYYLCAQCFKFHTLPKPTRNHQLLDKEQMLQGQIRTSPIGTCTEKCLIHEDKIIEYYCKTYCLLGCTACITLNHATCKGVQYIPHVANELNTNEWYKQVEKELRSALKAFEKVAENVQKNVERFETTCEEALGKIKDYRRKVEMAFDKLEAKLVEQAEEIKSKGIKELATISNKYRTAHVELQSALEQIEVLQNCKQHCNLYTEMMRTKDKLKTMNDQIKKAQEDNLYRESQVMFSPNQGTLDSLKDSEIFGILSGSAIKANVNQYRDTSTSARYDHYIHVRTKTDYGVPCIKGFCVLPDGRLLLADNGNYKIKIVNKQCVHVFTELKISPCPWDCAVINNNKVAVTLGDKVAIVIVGENSLRIDDTLKLTAGGVCRGIDYRNNKLAVSFCNINIVQVFNLQCQLLHSISADKQGKALFDHPIYLTFGQDDTTLYVSNGGSRNGNFVCVKLDGTVVATFTHSDLRSPMKPVLDSHGNVYVCDSISNQVHQISKECKKIRVLLTQADGLNSPQSICFGENEDKLYVGMNKNAIIKVYNIQRTSE